jgi:hypothetical protein
MAKVTVSRDSFARQETVREHVYVNHDAGCSECGKRGKLLSTGKYRLFRYGTETDGGTLRWANGIFCSITCFRCYWS